jgi:hypothetical protein
MSRILHSLIWAGAIIATALIANGGGLSEGASTGIVMGLTGAAWAALYNPGTCGGRTGCAQ